MNKSEMIDAMVVKTEMNKKDAEEVIKAFEEIITETLVKGEKVQLVGFMSLETVNVAEKECRNPQDGSTVISPAHKKIKVKVGKALKDAVNA